MRCAGSYLALPPRRRPTAPCDRACQNLAGAIDIRQLATAYHSPDTAFVQQSCSRRSWARPAQTEAEQASHGAGTTCWPPPQSAEVATLQVTALGAERYRHSVAIATLGITCFLASKRSAHLRSGGLARVAPSWFTDEIAASLIVPQTRSPAFHTRCGRSETRPLRDRCTAKRSVGFGRSSATTGARLSGRLQAAEGLRKIALIGVVTWRDGGYWPISLDTGGADVGNGYQLQRYRRPFPILSGEGVAALSEDAGFLGSVGIWQ